MAHEDSIDALAATQHGVVSRMQLLEAGVPVHVLEHRLLGGRLERVHTGVYRVRGHPESWHARVVAACLAAGPGATASHRSAAFLHQLDGIAPRCEITVGVGRGAALAGMTVHRTRQLERTDTEVVDGIRRTRVARTLIDLAAVVDPRPLERALDDALTRHLTTCQYLDRRLQALGRRGRPGARALGRLLAQREEQGLRLASEFERRLFALLHAAGVRLPVSQYEVRLPDGGRAYLDFAYPDLLLALEADSYRHHSSRPDWVRDHTRNRMLTALGWRILPVTWEDLGQPATLLGQLCVADPTLPGFRRAV